MSQELEGTLTNSANLVGTFGSTGSGTSNYNDLANKPSINNVELVGNKTGNQLGLVSDSDLATVATTGNYNDLLHKPTIPAAQVNSDWNAISGVARILNKPTIPTKTSDLTNDSGFITDSGLATVATTGDYDDLTNKPTIPAAQVNSDWDSTSGVSEILNKPTLSEVATSGSYNDLTDTPTIPTNSDFDLSGLGDVSISGATQGQVLTKGVSSWEASTLNIPTKTSDLNNDSGFVENTDLPIQLVNKYLSSACQWFTKDISQNTNTMTISTTATLSANESFHIILFGRYGAWAIRVGVGADVLTSAEVTKLESGSNTVTASVSGKTLTLTGLGTWSTFLGVIVKQYYSNVTFAVGQS